MPSSNFTKSLYRTAVAWAGQLTSLARSFAPAHDRDAISSKVETQDEGTYIIRLQADRRIAPDARAQELGSGLNARRGSPHTISIRPHGHKFLAFKWDVIVETAKYLPDGRILLPSVNHPGIKAANDGQGYLAPAVKELKTRGREQLTKDVRQAILADIRTSFGKKA